MAIKIPSLEAKSLEKIASRVINGEGLDVQNDALNHIISVSQGSARSVISYLEKAELIGGTITPEIAESLCTDISWKEFESYISLVENGRTIDATQLLYEVHNKGFSVMDILDNMFCFLKQTDVVDQDEVYVIVPVVCKYLMRLHDTHAHVTELAFFTRSIVAELRNHTFPTAG